MPAAFKLQSGFAPLVVRFRRLKREIGTIRKAGMRAVGIQVAAWAIQDYRQRSTGNPAAGVRWSPITRAAIATRLSKRAPWRNISASLQRMTEAERPLREELRRMMPRGGTTKQRGAIAHAFEAKHKVIAANRRRRKALKRKRQTMIDTEHARHAIGVDTGRLVNSLVFGEPALRSSGAPKMKAGTTAPPKATFQVREDSVTLGSNLSYAAAFDRQRPIFPPAMINEARRAELESLVADVYEDAIRKALGESTP